MYHIIDGLRYMLEITDIQAHLFRLMFAWQQLGRVQEGVDAVW